MLPPGQLELKEFPRFGVIEFAKRPLKRTEIRLEVSGDVDRPIELTIMDLESLPRVTLRQDFHCAAGWSYRGLEWSGFRFKDVWERFIAPLARGTRERMLVILRGEDGFRTSLPLSDLLAPDVLIADRLDGQPLSLEHGAPVRVIAPAHYGYKSAKHLVRVEVRADNRGYRPLLPRFMDHPRARVALEERGEFLPGWVLRYLFRPFIRPMVRKLKLLAESRASSTK